MFLKISVFSVFKNQTSEGGGVDLAYVAVRKLGKLNNYKLGIFDHKDKYKYKHWSKYTYIQVENKYELDFKIYLGILFSFIGMYSFSISVYYNYQFYHVCYWWLKRLNEQWQDLFGGKILSLL